MLQRNHSRSTSAQRGFTLIELMIVVVIVGIIALPLPGPGWLIIAGGLTILSKDVAWADRLLRSCSGVHAIWP